MDFKSQLKKEKLVEKIREKGRPATVSELQELSHIGEEGKWFDKLSDKDKLNYRQLPDISDQDSLKIMEDPKNLRRMPSDSVNAKLAGDEIGDKDLIKATRERLGFGNLKESMIPEEEMLKRAKAVSGDVPKAGSRMVSQLEKAGLKSRMDALLKMGSKAGKGLGRKAAGLAIGGPMMLASEMADAAELGPEKGSRDRLIESPIDSEVKQMLLRKQDVRDKVNSPDYFRELVQDEGKVRDMVDSLDKRSDEQREKDAEALLRKKQILSGMRIK